MGVDQLHESGAVKKFEDLTTDIDKTLNEMARCMSKVKRSSSLLKRYSNTQNLGQVADAMKTELPTGDEFVEIEGMVTGWVKKGEELEKKVKPVRENRDKQVMKAVEDTLATVEKEGTEAYKAWEKNDLEFYHSVEDAQNDMLKSWENTGIISDAEKLGHDIETQFKAWEKNMARRAPVQSLTAQQSKAVSKNLRSIEAELDMVLKSM